MPEKIEMPTKEQLKKDYDKLGSITKVAYKHDVSITTISNWFRKLGLKTIDQELKVDSK